MGRKPTPRERKVPGTATKKWLLQLFSFWQAEGLAGQTMDDWAIAVGKSKATLYAYFCSREEMVEAALGLKLKDLEAFAQPLRDLELPFQERYRAALKIVSGNVGEISTQFLKDLQSEYPAQWAMVQTFLSHVETILAEFYQGGIQVGAFKEYHPAILIQLDQVFFNQLTDPQFLQSLGISLSEALEQYVELKFQGLLSRVEEAVTAPAAK